MCWESKVTGLLSVKGECGNRMNSTASWSILSRSFKTILRNSESIKNETSHRFSAGKVHD